MLDDDKDVSGAYRADFDADTFKSCDLDLSEVLAAFNEEVHLRDRVKAVAAANEKYCSSSSEDIEVDDNAMLSDTNDPEVGGCWVMAWVWVTDEEIAEQGA